MQAPMEWWLQLSKGFLTPMIGVITVYIAWQQWKTNSDKVKLDKFDRRFAIYDAARELIRTVRQHSAATEQEIFEYRTKTRDAGFSLNDKLNEYLEEFADKAWEIHLLESDLKNEDNSGKISEFVDKQRKLKDWIGNQSTPLRQKFTPYLKLSL